LRKRLRRQERADRNAAHPRHIPRGSSAASLQSKEISSRAAARRAGQPRRITLLSG
jgi:hypothetical protein